MGRPRDSPEANPFPVCRLPGRVGALSLSTPSLRTLLPMCPEDARVASWVKTFCAFKKGVRPCYAWEPVIFYRGRNKNHPPPVKGGKQTTPKDFLLDPTEEPIPGDLVFAGPITLKKGLTGAKSEKFCRWVLDLLNAQPGDEVVDLFPGTGVMGRVALEVTGTLANKPVQKPAVQELGGPAARTPPPAISLPDFLARLRSCG